ncbi:ImmA/IrrE family metallo-endopeptidase [Pseudoclavibacter sp. 13-3]|uniref:ImmA/IrrE family metallo-endopeptidase n=1 Tax=Pseudoclavibacter sp. 13-3 TaxID=2901228 RepID=UPI001E5EAA7F|nr:ImmA/IrrE family metallo-endopeptidase [Pseudoclavibacter sp. 13-3]
MGAYDPWEHAEQLGIPVYRYPLKTAPGMWVPDQRAILMRPDLRMFEEICVLAHELVHAEYNDPAGHDGKAERRAHRIAAHRLIDQRELRALGRLYGHVDDRLCHELGVTREILTAALQEQVAS